MLSYVMIGANDVNRSERFYTPILGPLGYEMEHWEGKVIYSLPDVPDRHNGPGAIYINKPFDGGEATVGNGMMIALRAPTHAVVHALHVAGIAGGGTDEGAPGLREQYGDTFYVGYLRDPVGNKLAIFCNE